MFSFKSLLSISILVLVFSLVNCDEEEFQRRSRLRYKYNHPPAAENVEPIPVAIVYDKVIDRTSRQNKLPDVTETTTSTSEPKKSIATTEESQKATNKEEHTIKVEDTEDIAVKMVGKIKWVEYKNIEQEQQIPVAIVYDEKPVVPKINRVRKQRRRPVKPTTEPVNTNEPEQIKEPKANKTPKPEVTTVKETVKASTTPKPRQVTRAKSQDVTSKTATESTQIKKRVRERDPVIPIVESENRVFSHTGQFIYSYESGDGTKAYSTGELKTVDKDMAGEAVVGGFSYKDKDGMDISLSYTADENGYRPVGSHLPTPPPIPAAIARALKYLATKVTPEPVTEAINSD